MIIEGGVSTKSLHGVDMSVSCIARNMMSRHAENLDNTICCVFDPATLKGHTRQESGARSLS